MRRVLLVLLVACSSNHHSPATTPDAATVACGQLAETACNAEPACYALYTTNNEAGAQGGTFASCANGSATCTLSTGSSTGGCDYGGVGCPQGFAIAFSLSDGDCTKGFSIAGCVHTDACP